MDTPISLAPPAPNASVRVALTHIWAKPWLRGLALFLYYLGIIIALLLIYGRGDFTTAPFVYQGF